MKFLLLCLLAVSLFVNGCVVFQHKAGESAIRSSAPVRTYIAGLSVKGKAIKYTKFGDGPETVLLIGSIHGDERSGGRLLREFESYLKKNRSLFYGRTIITIPIANPDGFAKKTRFNANNVDINRNFPADNRVDDAGNGYFALSEPESWLLYKIINVYKPGVILTLHDSLGCIDYDGPAEGIAARLAVKCDLPVRKLGSRPGSLGSYAGLMLKIPLITVELSEEDVDRCGIELFCDYKDMLVEVVNF